MLKRIVDALPAEGEASGLPGEGMAMNMRKEEFSRAFLHAICAPAGFNVTRTAVDNDGIDATISTSRSFHRFSPKLDVQLKCTASFELREHDFSHSLPMTNYEALRGEMNSAPRILVVVLVPKECAGWVGHSEQSTVLQHCGYWCSLRDAPPPANPDQEGITVRIPRRQLLTVPVLVDMMRRVGDGGVP
ncbi:DUF4365 domain-containing protein [Myxococcus sp. CA039A]|uniref:DUF4365 domain-containing protein n=1 Tax=Myxococcus sp. CA039A TaxID=2741737 RepID=UPI00157A8F82|nr:DUF4365 domain-containing protein [Myxococcus sp. CA039A]NTX50409.1 DUF4365 domain-containing protein [Myxococcus sp. CA039A]